MAERSEQPELPIRERTAGETKGIGLQGKQSSIGYVPSFHIVTSSYSIFYSQSPDGSDKNGQQQEKLPCGIGELIATKQPGGLE